jgi:hypothetical protein
MCIKLVIEISLFGSYVSRCHLSKPSLYFIFCWLCISSQIVVNEQPDALFNLFIFSFHLSTCFEHQVLVVRRSNCINTLNAELNPICHLLALLGSATIVVVSRLRVNTSSGMISLYKWLLGIPVPPDRRTKQSLTQTNHTRWCIDTVRSPDDEQLMLETCREMKCINKYMKKFIRLFINKNFEDTFV